LNKNSSFDNNEENKSPSGDEIFSEESTENDCSSIENRSKSSSIKILSIKDYKYKELPPPNHSPNFQCYLHFAGKKFKTAKEITNK
jgi:hypothetical protein